MILFLLLLAGLWIPGRAQDPSGRTPVPTPPGQTLAAEAEAYAGSETCGLCHEDIARAFQQNAHSSVDNGRSKKIQAKAWASRACESCHGPGKAHAEAGDGKQIFVFTSAAAARVNQQCLACHAGDATHSGRLIGSHNRNQLACTNCHSIHHPAARRLLASAPNALCQSCHLEVGAEFQRPYRHKLQEGAITCADCHNPHGDLPPHDLRRAAANEVICLKCHGDKRGPFPFEHAPVRLTSCSTCHEPHGSANPRMLTRHDQSLLCLECHTTTLGFAGVTPPAFHDLRSARFRNCTICHSKIHGSYISRDLLR